MRRVVVTGMGIVSPLGSASIITGSHHGSKSGLRTIKAFDASDLRRRWRAKCRRRPRPRTAPASRHHKYIEHKEQKKMDLFIHYGYVAAVDAVEDSGWKPEDYEGQCAPAC